MSSMKNIVGKRPRLLRGRVVPLLGTLAMVVAVALSFVVSAGPASAKSPCEDGAAVGRICHYVYIVSEGPHYDADMEMQTLDHFPYPGVAKWHEGDRTSTRWFWDYDQSLESPDFQLHLTVHVRGTNWGLDRFLGGNRDTCLQVSRATNQVFEVQCPLGGGTNDQPV